MKTSLGADHLRVTPGVPCVLAIEVTNTASVIDGVTATVDGLDPSWVRLTTPVLSLFPESTGVITVQLDLPRNCLAGDYLITVRVQSTIAAERSSTQQFWLTVEPVSDVSMQLRPSLVVGGKRAEFTAFLANAGNVPTDIVVRADEETKAASTVIDPPALTVAPGTVASVKLGVSGPRPWFGQSVSRAINVTASGETVELAGVATFTQKPRIPRGVLTILILAGIIALWATIFLVIIDALREGNDPAKAVPASFNEGGATDVPLLAIAGAASGQVSAKTTGEGVARVTVDAFRQAAGGASELIGSVATGDDGAYELPTLLPGAYKLRFTGEGFQEIWYPNSPAEGGATEVRVEPTKATAGLDVVIEGNPGSFTGLILAPEGAGEVSIEVTITQVVPPAEASEEPGAEEGADSTAPAEPATEPFTTQITTNGPLDVSGLPSPAAYQFVIVSEGYETLTFEETLGPGEIKVLNTVRLGAALGSISGQTFDGNGNALGGVTVVVSSGEFVKEAVTPTEGNVGAYLIDGLETPKTYVVTFLLDGFATVSLALDLGAGEQRGDVNARLTGGLGAVTGTVTGVDGSPLGGVRVTVAGGLFRGETETLTAGAVGTYVLSGLPTPGSFTVTFSGAGLLPETRLVTFSVPGPIGGVDAVLTPSTGTLSGTASAGGVPSAGVSITLSSGATESDRTTVSATSPVGAYSFTLIEPGTYTLTFRRSGFETRVVQVRVSAGAQLLRNVDIPAVAP